MLLIFWKNPRKWNYGWTSMLKICTTFIVGIFKRFCCFDEVFLMALTSTEQLFIEKPLYRRFLHYSQNSQENTCGKVSFLVKLQAEVTASDLSSIFSWRLLVYFISIEKWKNEMKKGKESGGVQIFLLVYRFVWRQQF